MGQKLHTSSARIAKTLLDIGGITLSPDQPFVLASGLRAPIYCDNRLMLSYPDARNRITDAFVASLEGVKIDTIVGVATAGIAYAAFVADRLKLPMAYARSKPKGHGRRNQIEGKLERGNRVVIIEDLVSTGKSSLVAVDAVRKVTGIPPLAVWAIVSYNLKGVAARFADVGTPLRTLTTFETLMHVALESRSIRASDVDNLRRWQQDVEGWSATYRDQESVDR